MPAGTHTYVEPKVKELNEKCFENFKKQPHTHTHT